MRWNCWKTRPITFLRMSVSWAALRLPSSRPSSLTEPFVGVSMQPTMFMSVVLPEPEEPTTESHWPRGTSRLRSSRACSSP